MQSRVGRLRMKAQNIAVWQVVPDGHQVSL